MGRIYGFENGVKLLWSFKSFGLLYDFKCYRTKLLNLSFRFLTHARLCDLRLIAQKSMFLSFEN